MEKEKKKAITEAYKARKVLGGVYSITNRETGEKYIFAAQDLEGAENRFRFMQSTDSCTVLAMQKEWRIYGKDAFVFEILETLEKKEEETAKAFKEEVAVLAKLWQEKTEEPGDG